MPEVLLRGLDRFGIHLTHMWGMTETTPMASMARDQVHAGGRSEDEATRSARSRECPSPFVEMRVMRPRAKRRGMTRSAGELEVRGPWVAASYLEAPETSDRWSKDGWFRTGDIATIDAEGYMTNRGPQQGPDQIGRRMDQLGGSGKCADGPSRRARSGRDWSAASRSGRSGRWRWWWRRKGCIWGRTICARFWRQNSRSGSCRMRLSSRANSAHVGREISESQSCANSMPIGSGK